jgi:putative alpha-1,2-mannosidase
MSAWFVLSALGFYPVFPASGQYILGRPFFDSVTLELENGRSFSVRAVGNSHENIYIQSATLNGMQYERTYITHDALVRGETLELVMGNQPNKSFGLDKSARPPSVLRDN